MRERGPKQVWFKWIVTKPEFYNAIKEYNVDRWDMAIAGLISKKDPPVRVKKTANYHQKIASVLNDWIHKNRAKIEKLCFATILFCAGILFIALAYKLGNSGWKWYNYFLAFLSLPCFRISIRLFVEFFL